MRPSRRQEPSACSSASPRPARSSSASSDLTKAFGPKHVFDGLGLRRVRGRDARGDRRLGHGQERAAQVPHRPVAAGRGAHPVRGPDLTPASRRRTSSRVRRHVAMVFQGSALFDSLTVGENIAYPLREHFPRDGRGRAAPARGGEAGAGEPAGHRGRCPSDFSGGMRSAWGWRGPSPPTRRSSSGTSPPRAGPVTTAGINELINSMKTKLGCHLHRRHARHGERLRGRRPHRDARQPAHRPGGHARGDAALDRPGGARLPGCAPRRAPVAGGAS